MDETTMAFHPVASTNELSSPLSSVPSSAASDSDLSELSNSPTPPPEFAASFASRPSYPSPSSSRRSSAKTSPAPENMASPPSSQDEDPRPRKKRKVADPKERTTERLDFTTDLTDADKPQLQRLLNVLHKKRKIVVIAGAGISVSAGIPDFRSSTGLFKSLRKQHKLKSSGKDLFDASVYQDDSATSSFHDMVRTLSQQTKSAQPTAFHHLLATLAQEGRLMRLYTQNVDGIDTALPPLKTQVPLPKKAPWPKTIQVHGGLDHMVCSKCNSLSDFDAEKFVGPVPPACPNCVENDSVRQVAEKRSHGIGRLRPRMVLYNEHNPDDEAIGSCATTDIRHRPDAVIVAGTTLKVPGVRRIVREMCATVRDRRDGVTIWINNDPEPVGKDLANAWDLVIKGPADEVARHAAMRKWDDPMDFKEVTDEDLLKAKGGQKAEVVIGTPKKLTTVIQTAGQLTPGQSPRMVPCTTIKQESDLQPPTPSKKGTKRKSDAQSTLTGKPATKAPSKKTQTQKKAPGEKGRGRKKEAKKETQPITGIFKAAKASVRPSGKAADKLPAASKFVPSKYNTQIDIGTIHVAIPPDPTTPKHRDTLVTKIKPHYAMAPLSSSDPRNNQSPTRPEVEGFTPIKPRTLSQPIDEASQQLLQEAYLASPTSNSRPSTAGSFKNEIEHVHPERIPNGLKGLIH